MPSLLDIGPLTEEVTIRGVKLTVHGLTAAELFKLFVEVPAVRTVLDGADPRIAMLALAPDIIGKIIAIVTGSPGDAAAEAKARELSAADQLTLMEAVGRLSFPEGLGPFAERVRVLMGEAPKPAPAPSGKASATKSRQRLDASLQTDTPGMMRGTPPHAN